MGPRFSSLFRWTPVKEPSTAVKEPSTAVKELYTLKDTHDFSISLSYSLSRPVPDQNQKNSFQQLNEWKHIPVNIAVIGSADSEKSSLIKALLGLTAKNDGAARNDVDECAKEKKVHVHPHYKNLRFWDLPGAESYGCPQARYFECIQAEKYDILVIVFSRSVSEIVSWLESFEKRSDKTVIFVRTNVDIDVYKHNRAYPQNTKSETEILQPIREDFVKCFPRAWMSETELFLIDTFDTSKYDFEKFLRNLADDAPAVKCSAIDYRLNIYSPVLIENKVNELKARIPDVSLAAATGAEEVRQFTLDVGKIMAELLHYRETFGINEEELKHVAEVLKISVDVWKEHVPLKCVRLTTNTDLYKFLYEMGSIWEFSRNDEASQDVCKKFIENCLEELLHTTADDAVVNFMAFLFFAERVQHGTPV